MAGKKFNLNSTDDGRGVATTLGAAKAILLSGFKPKRTIRFVIFIGEEEEGLLGSLAYTKTHKDELTNHVAAKMLVEKHDDGFLKAFGLWPFGDLGKPAEEKPASSGGAN